MHDTLNNRSLVSYELLSEQQKFEIKQQVSNMETGTAAKVAMKYVIQSSNLDTGSANDDCLETKISLVGISS